jgi:hypothetical protein
VEIRRRSVAALVASAVVVLAAGCGSTSPAVDIGGTAAPPAATSPTTNGSLADCGTILRTYLSLAATAAKGQNAAASAQQTLDGIKSKLPAELQSDLAVVARAFGTMADKGVGAGLKALSTPAFKKANENILHYLRDECLPGS